ncbi:hypothetical protein BU17DRAFT_65324 [Hysterangium stoloniferum]|nr:hypothetical protein BU17DRAFT_72596 [Hysterangium stoloniferum]KAF8520633.1 hypothetical protein BU17DRAFT_65324 [Hysterangium stoloniferum]
MSSAGVGVGSASGSVAGWSGGLSLVRRRILKGWGSSGYIQGAVARELVKSVPLDGNLYGQGKGRGRGQGHKGKKNRFDFQVGELCQGLPPPELSPQTTLGTPHTCRSKQVSPVEASGRPAPPGQGLLRPQSHEAAAILSLPDSPSRGHFRCMSPRLIVLVLFWRGAMSDGDGDGHGDIEMEIQVSIGRVGTGVREDRFPSAAATSCEGNKVVEVDGYTDGTGGGTVEDEWVMEMEVSE